MGKGLVDLAVVQPRVAAGLRTPPVLESLGLKMSGSETGGELGLLELLEELPGGLGDG